MCSLATVATKVTTMVAITVTTTVATNLAVQDYSSFINDQFSR